MHHAWIDPDRFSLSQALLLAAERRATEPAFYEFEGQAWRPCTYADFARRVRAAARGLVQLGVTPGDRVGLVGPNSVPWAVSYAAILHAGGVVVPLDRLQTPLEWTEILARAGAGILMAAAREGQALRATEAGRAAVRQLIWISDGGGSDAPGTLALDRLGDLAPDSAPDLPERSPDDLAAIIFTSGTTGRSKGVMLTHRNILWDAWAVLQVVSIRGSADAFLSVLPLSHCYESTCGLIAPLLAGARIYYARSLTPTEIVEDLKSSRATFLLGVPLLYEKIAGGIQRGLERGAGPPGRVLAALLRALSRAPAGIRRRLGRLLFGAVRNRAGLASVRFLISGGAPLRPDVGRTLEALGLRILQGYGLTETAPVATLNPLRGAEPASVGLPLPGVRIRLDGCTDEGEGEILIAGPIVTQGYWQDPEATRSAVRDGWLATGDRGRLGRGGHLYITGRSKNLIITPGGKNIAPEEIELAAAKSPFIAEIIVFGGRTRDGSGEEVQAAIYPNREHFEEWSRTAGRTEELAAVLRRELDRTMAQLAPYKRIVRFEISGQPFAKTTTQKIKRHAHTHSAVR